MYFLPRRVGLPKAKELIFTGRKVDVDEALALGIVDRKTSADTLLADAQAWAAELSKGSGTALALTKTILNQSFELSSQQVFAQGSQAQGICYTSTEHRESVLAFLAKSAPAPRSDGHGRDLPPAPAAQRRRHRRLGRPDQDRRPPGGLPAEARLRRRTSIRSTRRPTASAT